MAWYQRTTPAISTRLLSPMTALWTPRQQRNFGADTMALHCDVIIRDATVFDGPGASRFKADIGVIGDRITAIGDLGSATADTEVIATGNAVAPGFIDAHTHDHP